MSQRIMQSDHMALREAIHEKLNSPNSIVQGQGELMLIEFKELIMEIQELRSFIKNLSERKTAPGFQADSMAKEIRDFMNYKGI